MSIASSWFAEKRVLSPFSLAVPADARKPAPDADFHSGVKNAITAYVFREARRTQGTPEAAPLEVRAWLAVNDQGLRAVARQARTAPALTWATDIDDWQSSGHFGLADLHAALLAQAFQSLHDRGRGASDDFVEAAWQLTDALRKV